MYVGRVTLPYGKEGDNMGKKYLKVMVSKPMENALNTYAKLHGIPYSFKLGKCDYNAYHWYVDGSLSRWAFSRDYDTRTDMYKYIQVTYPDEYYACPQYLTTNMLNDIWVRHTSEKTWNGFMKAVMDAVEI